MKLALVEIGVVLSALLGPLLLQAAGTRMEWIDLAGRSPGTDVLVGVVVLVLVLPFRAATSARARSRSLASRVLIIGSSPLAEKLVAEILARPRLRYDVVGVVDDRAVAAAGGLWVGRLEDLVRLVDELRPDRIIVALRARRGRMPVQQLLDFGLRGIVLEDGAEAYERITGKVAIEWLTPSGLIFSRDLRRDHFDPAVLHLFGLVTAAVGLVALAPALALIAITIKLDSPGPVLFVQDRVGLGGRRFRLLKFRTMRTVSSNVSEWARDNGHRITRAGRWLRKFRLDELPQLANILRGEMSFVGPRPHPVSSLAMLVVMLRNAPECGERIPFYSLRCSVRPGLTGWAQVRYRYANDLEEEVEKMRYDLYYLKHRSLWLDLRILLDTVKIVLLGREQTVERPRPSHEPRREKLMFRSLVAALLVMAASGALGSESRPSVPKIAGGPSVEYRIGPEDVLQISVWKNESLSRTVPVRPDGQISLPLLNDIAVAGLTPMQLRDALIAKLTPYMPAPEVSVIVTEVRSFKVSVIGDVPKPDRYELRSSATVMDVLAMAGGPTEFASRSRIVVLRANGGKVERIPFDYNKVSTGDPRQANFLLRPGDIVVVP